MESSSQSFDRRHPAPANVKYLHAPEPAPAASNPFEQVNRLDHAHWNRIVEEISKLDVAQAVIHVMDERDTLKALYPSIYVRAHQTRIAAERKAQRHARRVAIAKKVGSIAFGAVARFVSKLTTGMTHSAPR